MERYQFFVELPPALTPGNLALEVSADHDCPARAVESKHPVLVYRSGMQKKFMELKLRRLPPGTAYHLWEKDGPEEKAPTDFSVVIPWTDTRNALRAAVHKLLSGCELVETIPASCYVHVDIRGTPSHARKVLPKIEETIRKCGATLIRHALIPVRYHPGMTDVDTPVHIPSEGR